MKEDVGTNQEKLIESVIVDVQDTIKDIHSIILCIKNSQDKLDCTIKNLREEATDTTDRLTLIDSTIKALDKDEKGASSLFAPSPYKNEYINQKVNELKREITIEKGKDNKLTDSIKEVQNHLDNNQQVLDLCVSMISRLNTSTSLLNDIKENNKNMDDECYLKELMGIKILETQDMERQRIAREMHDGPVQNLTNLVHKTELCMRLVDRDIARTKLELQILINSLRRTIDDTRNIIYDLRPMSIDDLGLILTLERYLEKLGDEVDFTINFQVINNELDIPPVARLTFFRIIQEALNNIVKYSKATKVDIILSYNQNSIELTISDNGIGFDLEEVENNRSKNRGFGLPMMRERVSLLSGEIVISSQKDNGTRYYVKVPLIFNKEEK